MGSSTATLPWSDHYIYAHTKLNENHTESRVDVSCANIPVAGILLAVIASPVTPPCIKKYIRGQCPFVLSISQFANCTAEKSHLDVSPREAW